MVHVMYLQRQSKQILMLVISGIPRALHAIGHFLRKEIDQRLCLGGGN